MIYVTRLEEPAKLNSTVVPGCSSSNCAVRLVKAAFSDAVAKTVIEPLRVSAAVDDSAAGLGVEAQPARVSVIAVSVTRVIFFNWFLRVLSVREVRRRRWWV